MDRLKGKIAIISGGATGMGAASARLFAAEGAAVGVIDRNVEAGEALVAELVAAGHRAVFARADVSLKAEVEAAVASVTAALGPANVLFNHAGTIVIKPFLETEEADWDFLFDVNVKSMYLMTRAVLPHMRRQRGGRIVNIGSVVGFLPAPFMALYAATKHAVEGYSESLDHEVRPFGIRVAVIEPWATRTSIEANSPQGDRPVAAYAKTLARYRTAFDAAMAAGDTAEDVAATVLAAAQDRTPRLRYPSGKAAKQTAFARRFLPRSVFDRTLRKQFNIA